MPLHIYGINYRTAPIELREHMAIAHENLAAPLSSLLVQPSVSEAMILATCNRCELYTLSEEPQIVKDWLNIKHLLSAENFSSFVYEYCDEAAMRHLLRVACGLDSMALGESQILGQLKHAFIEAKRLHAIGPQLGHLVENVLAKAKKIRSNTGLNQHRTSVASTAVSLAKGIFQDLTLCHVLLVGAGETAELAAHHFFEQGVAKIITANRTLKSAEGLATRFAGESIALSELPLILKQVDIVISATASSVPIVTTEQVATAMNSRQQRPLYLIDIAMPRDVEPQVAALTNVYLYNIDDLQHLAADGLHERQQAAQLAENIIDAWLQQYQQNLQGKEFITAIKSYRQRVEDLRQAEVAKALRSLKNGQEPEQVLTTLAKGLTNKLMHYPTVQLRRARQTGKIELLDVARQLFGVEQL